MDRRSITRTEARDMEAKIKPAIKALSMSVMKTGRIPDNFVGYKVPAGDFDTNGIKCQLQVWAVYSKSHRIKKNEVVPIIRKGAILFKFRLWIKHIVDWSNIGRV